MVYQAKSNRYEQMLYRRVGQSGLKLPAVSLGLWRNFGDETPMERILADIKLTRGSYDGLLALNPVVSLGLI